jgi:hypothetical protein
MQCSYIQTRPSRNLESKRSDIGHFFYFILLHVQQNLSSGRLSASYQWSIYHAQILRDRVDENQLPKIQLSRAVSHSRLFECVCPVARNYFQERDLCLKVSSLVIESFTHAECRKVKGRRTTLVFASFKAMCTRTARPCMHGMFLIQRPCIHYFL